MKGMGLIFTAVLARCLLGYLGLSGPMTSTSWTHGYSKQSYRKVLLKIPNVTIWLVFVACTLT